MGLLRVALRIEFENPVVLVHSCVRDRLRPREIIGFNDNSRYLSRILMRGYGCVLGLSFVAGLSFIQGGEISGNVDNDMNVRFICKRHTIINNNNNMG